MQEGIPTRSVSHRLDVISDLVKNKEVLDLGVVDARVARGNAEERFDRSGKILFFQLAEINPDIVGLDLDEEGVEALKKRGYNAVCGDVHVVDLNKKFDTIIAGEIIEHLDNPGQFLCNMFRHLKPGGRLVVSTPNPFYAKQRGKIWRRGLPQVHEEHTWWTDQSQRKVSILPGAKMCISLLVRIPRQPHIRHAQGKECPSKSKAH